MGRRRFSLLAGIAVATTAHASTLQIKPSALRAEIAHRGAKAVVDRLYASHAYEDVVIKRIRAGMVEWVLLAPALSEGTDAATSEELGDALVHALPKAPQAVLSVIDASGRSIPRSVDTVCSASFYEGDLIDPKRYQLLAIRAVQEVADPALRGARGLCLAQLKQQG